MHRHPPQVSRCWSWAPLGTARVKPAPQSARGSPGPQNAACSSSLLHGKICAKPLPGFCPFSLSPTYWKITSGLKRIERSINNSFCSPLPCFPKGLAGGCAESLFWVLVAELGCFQYRATLVSLTAELRMVPVLLTLGFVLISMYTNTRWVYTLCKVGGQCSTLIKSVLN